MDALRETHASNPFHLACITGNMSDMLRLFEENNGRDFDKETGLFLAAMFGHADVVQFLTQPERRYFVHASVVQAIRAVFLMINDGVYPVNTTGFQVLIDFEVRLQPAYKLRILNRPITHGSLAVVEYTVKTVKPIIPNCETSYVYRAIFDGRSLDMVQLLIRNGFPYSSFIIWKVLLFAYFDKTGFMEAVLELLLTEFHGIVFMRSYPTMQPRNIRMIASQIRTQRTLQALEPQSEAIPDNIRPFVAHIYRATISAVFCTVISYLQLLHEHPVLIDVLTPFVITPFHLRALDRLESHCLDILERRGLVGILQNIRNQCLSFRSVKTT